MATGSFPISNFVAALLTVATGGVAQSGSLTVTVQVTGGWELQIPIQFSHVGSISADPLCFVYASMDGGVTYDSNPFQVYALPRVPGAAGGGRQTSIRVTTGMYCLQLLNSGPNSANFGVGTQNYINTIYNV